LPCFSMAAAIAEEEWLAGPPDDIVDPLFSDELEQIEKDVPRTFWASSVSQEHEPRSKWLPVILTAYAWKRHCSGVGAPYTQGMNFLAMLAIEICGHPDDGALALSTYTAIVDRVMGVDFYAGRVVVGPHSGDVEIEVPLMDCTAAIEAVKRLLIECQFVQPEGEKKEAQLDLAGLVCFRWLPAGCVSDWPRSLAMTVWRWALKVALCHHGADQIIPLLVVVVAAFHILLSRVNCSSPDSYQALCLECAAMSEQDVLPTAQAIYKLRDVSGWATWYAATATPIREQRRAEATIAHDFHRLQCDTHFTRGELRALLAALGEFNGCCTRFDDPVSYDAFRAICAKSSIRCRHADKLWEAVHLTKVAHDNSVTQSSISAPGIALTLRDIAVGLSRCLRGSFEQRVRFCFDAFAGRRGHLDREGLRALQDALLCSARRTSASLAQLADVSVLTRPRVSVTSVAGHLRRAEDDTRCSAAVSMYNSHLTTILGFDEEGLRLQDLMRRLQYHLDRQGSVSYQEWRSEFFGDPDLCSALMMVVGVGCPERPCKPRSTHTVPPREPQRRCARPCLLRHLCLQS